MNRVYAWRLEAVERAEDLCSSFHCHQIFRYFSFHQMAYFTQAIITDRIGIAKLKNVPGTYRPSRHCTPFFSEPSLCFPVLHFLLDFFSLLLRSWHFGLIERKISGRKHEPRQVSASNSCVIFRNILKLFTWVVFHLFACLIIVGLPPFQHLSSTRSGTLSVLFITRSPVSLKVLST